MKDISPKLSIKSADQELAREYVVGSRPLGESIGGLQMFSNSFKRGYGDKVFGSSEEGIWLGAADFGDAPFRVNMEGNAVLTSVTASGYIAVGGAADDIGEGQITGVKIASGTITGDKIAANTITAGKLNVSELSAITANLGNITAGSISAGIITTGTLNVDRIAGESITGGKIANNTIANAKISDLSADKINAGTLTGITVQSGTGNERIVLSNGNYIYFYANGSLKCQLRGTTAGSGGLSMTGDLVLQNNKSVLIASSGGGSSEYGGISITSGNQFWLTLGTNNTFYIKNNAQNDNYFTVSHSQAYHRDKFTANWGEFTNINNTSLYGNTIWYWNLNHYCEMFVGDPFEVMASFAPRSGRRSARTVEAGENWRDVDHSKLHKDLYREEKDNKGKRVREGYDLSKLVSVHNKAILELKAELDALRKEPNGQAKG